MKMMGVKKPSMKMMGMKKLGVKKTGMKMLSRYEKAPIFYLLEK